MLRFKEYRNKLTFTEEDALPQANAQSNTANIVQQINQVVDSWVSELKATLINPTSANAQRRGLWDRFKNSMSNMWHGRYSQSNPYFWKNKLGDDLGSTTEALDPNKLSLFEYKSLRDICESLEQEINEDAIPGTQNLRIVGLIDSKAKELKQRLMSIVGQASQQSANPAPNANSASSMSVPADMQAEEPDSKSVGYDKIITILKSLVDQGQVQPNEAMELEKNLNSKKESIRRKASDEVMAIHDKMNAANPAASSSLGSNPTSSNSPDSESSSLFTPPTNNKKWSELDPDEKSRWDIYGGGAANASGTKVDGCLNDHGIDKMPWIMRIGDPRRAVLAAQKEGKLEVSGKCSKLPRSYWFNILHNLGRWEDDQHPIQTASELQSRIERAKAATAEAKKRMPRTVASDADAVRNSAVETPETKPEVSPVSPVVNQPEVPKEEPKSLKDRVADIGNEVPEIKDKLSGTGLSEPMHSNDEEPDLKNRTAGIDGANAIPDKEQPEKSLLQLKQELKARIDAINDEDTRTQLIRNLKRVKTKEDLKDIEQELGIHELSNFEIEWSIVDLKNFYKRRLNEGKQIVKQEHKEKLSFNESLTHYKNLLINK